MSIQQSINQAISGSLYLLGQSTLFRTLKEERDLKVQRDRLEKEAKLNAPRDKGVNTPQPQEQEVQNAQDESAAPGQPEGNMTEESAPKPEFPYAQQIAEFDLQQHLESRVAEAARAEQLARAFRDHISGGGDSLG